MKLLRKQTASLEKIVRNDYRHILRDCTVKLEPNGRLTGQVVFLKLNKRREILGMAKLPFAANL